MFDDGHRSIGRRIELAHQFPARIQVHKVVVAQLLALKLLSGRNALSASIDIQGPPVDVDSLHTATSAPTDR